MIPHYDKYFFLNFRKCNQLFTRTLMKNIIISDIKKSIKNPTVNLSSFIQ